jgi:hypothetical protein
MLEKLWADLIPAQRALGNAGHEDLRNTSQGRQQNHYDVTGTNNRTAKLHVRNRCSKISKYNNTTTSGADSCTDK